MTTRNICVLFESTGASRDGSASPFLEPFFLLIAPPGSHGVDARKTWKFARGAYAPRRMAADGERSRIAASQERPRC